MLRWLVPLLALTAPIAGAAAAPPPASLTKPPGTVTVGTRWVATLTVRTAPAPRPRVEARLGTRRLTVTATRTTRRTVFRVVLTFPAAGRWQVRLGGRTLRTVTVVPAPPPIAGTTATALCSGSGPPYPQVAAARGDGALWIGCHSQRRLVRVDEATGRAAQTMQLAARPWAVAAGSGAVWVVDRTASALDRIDPASGRRVSRTSLPGLPVYVWHAAGAVWVGLGDGTQLARVDPATETVTLLDVGDGASGLASDGRDVWVVCHRDNTLWRIDGTTRAVTRLALAVTGNQPAADRITLAAGSLWVTGRGLDLFRLDPATGRTQATIDVGLPGIDVAGSPSGIVVPSYTAAGEPTGNPFVDAVRIVDPATNAVRTTLRASGRVVLTGIAGGDAVWLADTSVVRLVRIPA